MLRSLQCLQWNTLPADLCLQNPPQSSLVFLELTPFFWIPEKCHWKLQIGWKCSCWYILWSSKEWVPPVSSSSGGLKIRCLRNVELSWPCAKLCLTRDRLVWKCSHGKINCSDIKQAFDSSKYNSSKSKIGPWYYIHHLDLIDPTDKNISDHTFQKGQKHSRNSDWLAGFTHQSHFGKVTTIC